MKELALFLGAKIVQEKTLNPLITKWISPKFKPLDGRFLSGHELKFDKDWNWIMAVVNKLHSIKENVSHEHWHIFDMCFETLSHNTMKGDINAMLVDCTELVKYIKIHKIKFDEENG